MVKFPFYARLALTLFAIALVILFMWLAKSLLVPLFFSFLVAILLHPLVRFFERRRFPRALASILSLLLFLVLFGGLFYFFSHQVVRLSRDLPSLQAKVVEKWQDIKAMISDKYHINSTQRVDYMNKSANGILNTAMNSVATTFVGIAETIVLTIFFFIFTFFILQYRRLLMRFVVELFDNAHNEKVQGIITRIRSLINSYVVGLLIEMSVVAVIIFSSLMIIGIKYALLISVMAAVLNIIPYLGIYCCMAIAMVITAATNTTGHIIAVGIVFLVTHFIDANVILPHVVGGKMKMNPFITILAVLVGHLIWGIPGMFLFIPLTAMIRLVCEEIPAMKPWAILMSEEKGQE
ncbi:MAG TPA: AI-2E family transporter [Puia sp.]